MIRTVSRVVRRHISRSSSVALPGAALALRTHVINQNGQDKVPFSLYWALGMAATASLVASCADSEGSKLPDEIIDELKAIVGADHVSFSAEECANRAKPWNSYHQPTVHPSAIVSPLNTEEVSQILQLCNEHSIAIVPFGGGTALEGQTLNTKGGSVSLDMKRMQQILRLSVADQDVTVQAGIGYVELNDYLSFVSDLFFPLDPGPGASIGGMCACRCSGSTAVKYGTMKDNVLSLTAVLADGTVIKTGQRARKSAAGYDLTRLLIGSEGTLGIITEVTLQLRKRPEHTAAVLVAFPSTDHAARASMAVRNAGVEVGRCEMMDDVMIKIVNGQTDNAFTETPSLLFELIGSEEHVKEQLRKVESVVSDNHASEWSIASNQEEAHELWRIRKEALWAASSAYPSKTVMITDVCVPIASLPRLFTLVKKELDASPLICPTVAHAGDGNFHTFLLFDPNDPQEVKEAKRLASLMAEMAISFDGTCTGEHGVGVGKREFLPLELGQAAVATMQQIKDKLDPKNILNPDKVLPPLTCESAEAGCSSHSEHKK